MGFHNHKFFSSSLHLSAKVITSVAVFNFVQSHSFAISEKAEKIYRRDEISKHKTKDSRVWVTYKDGIYDITDFIQNHPGGADKIILAAGGSVEPFWKVYQQHYNSKLPIEMLSKMRIGTLHPDDVTKESEANKMSDDDPYKNDPQPSPILLFHQKKPINAEPPENLVTDSWITPIPLWFVRNHHPVPVVDENTYKLIVTIPKEYTKNKEKDLIKEYSLNELKSKFKQSHVISSIQCGGNRRSEMNQVDGNPATLGSPWNGAAISTADWSGIRLLELLIDAGLELEYIHKIIDQLSNITTMSSDDMLTTLSSTANKDLPVHKDLHVQFSSLDGMEASVPMTKAIDRYGDVTLVYNMNNTTLPPSHGFPLRVIVPGHVGVRNVKWVNKITISDEEAQGPWQRGLAYKGFGPSVKKVDGINVEEIPSLQEMPVTSMITIPPNQATIYPGIQTLKGFAYSGGGRGIIRVDVSADGGRTWKTAELTEGKNQPLNRAWAWTFWECDIDIPEIITSSSSTSSSSTSVTEENQEKSMNRFMEIICKATDSSYNVQPDSVSGIWNLRGINNNAWHRKQVVVVPEPEESYDDEDDDE